MINRLAMALAICFTLSVAAQEPVGVPPPVPDQAAGQGAAQGDGVLFTPDQLDNLLAPVALYPDPLLAQVLIASTFVDQIDVASRMVRANKDPRMIDAQSWDVSVKSVAHYPTVLNMMSDKLDWTTAVGQAYVSQSTDVTASIQRLRNMAHNQGNLVTTPQQEVNVDNGNIAIDPAQPQTIYVPTYDPALIYYGRGDYMNFGFGWGMGPWLNYDFNWGFGGIFYTGWGLGYGGWIGRSRGFYGGPGIYINAGFRNVGGNREVLGRGFNSGNLNRYNSVHSGANYNHVAANTGANRVINHNVNSNDSRINANRGRTSGGSPAAQRSYTPSNTPYRGQSAADSRAASQRGQSSRQQQAQPQRQQSQRSQPAQRSAPQRSAPQAPRGGGGGGHPGGGGHGGHP
jgi:hypothetical protein